MHHAVYSSTQLRVKSFGLDLRAACGSHCLMIGRSVSIMSFCNSNFQVLFDRDLGVLLDNQLTTKQHVNRVASTCSFISAFLGTSLQIR